MTDSKRLQAILADLHQLAKTHHFKISGCGCCSSPWLILLDDNDQSETSFHDTLHVNPGHASCWIGSHFEMGAAKAESPSDQ